MSWRSRASTGWSEPSGPPVTLIVLVVAAACTAVAISTYRYASIWKPLQRRYLSSYLLSVVPVIGRGPYDLLQLTDRNGRRRLALDDDVVTVTSGSDTSSFMLSEAAVKAGASHLIWQPDASADPTPYVFLRHRIYADQSLTDLTRPAIWGAFAVFIGGVIGAASQDLVHARAWRAGRSSRTSNGVIGSPFPTSALDVRVVDRPRLTEPRALMPVTSSRAVDPVAVPGVAGPRTSSPPSADRWLSRFFW